MEETSDEETKTGEEAGNPPQNRFRIFKRQASSQSSVLRRQPSEKTYNLRGLA